MGEPPGADRSALALQQTLLSRALHLPVQELLERLPEEEWPHWIEHLVETPVSANFLKMRQAAGACIDDGDTEAWEA